MTDPRTSPAAFGAWAGKPLTAVQTRATSLEARTTVILAPRQTGKTRSLAVLVAWWAARRARQVVLIVAAIEDSAKRDLREVGALLADSDLARSVLDEQAGLIRLSNGSEIRSVSASERAVRGWSVDLLVIDEASLISDDVALSAALPTVAARPDARVVMASSPWSESGFFYDHVAAGDSEHVRVHRWSLADAPWVSKASVEAARQSMPSARFAAEFEARWASSLDALFSRQVLERSSADLSLPSFRDLRGPAKVLGGLDHGVVGDRSAVAWIARTPVAALNPDADPERPVFVARAEAWAPGTPLSDTVSDVVASPAHWATFASETNGVGAGPTQELWRRLRERPWEAGGGQRARAVVVPVVPEWDPVRPARRVARPAGFVTTKVEVATTAQKKALNFERMLWLMDREQLVIERGSDLMREFAALRLELSPGGAEKIEAARGHDDLADAVYLAALPWKDGSRLRCHLADLADRRRPEAPAPDLDEPVVETGGGLRLHRRPALQSPAGDELTLPEGARPRGPRPSPRLLDAQRRVAEALQQQRQEVT